MIRKREEWFHVEADHLFQRVIPERGKPYIHRCPRAAYEAVAHAADDMGQEGFTLETLMARAGTKSTPTAAALAFMIERGVVYRDFPKRVYGASAEVFEDAMIEYCVLAEEDPHRRKN